MTGNTAAYLSGYRGRPQELVSAAKYGFLHQGQYYTWQKNRRGTPSLRVEPKHFVNRSSRATTRFRTSRAAGACISSRRPGVYRALTGLLLLSPQTPMLFQGEEFGSTSPFPFFAGHSGDLAKAVLDGRTKFLEQFPGLQMGGGAVGARPVGSRRRWRFVASTGTSARGTRSCWRCIAI